MESTVKIVAKAVKAFRADNGEWYNLTELTQPYYDKTAKEDIVQVSYVKEKGRNIVNKLVKTTSSVTKKTTEPKPEETKPTGFICEVCGRELKDNKYKLCYTCNEYGLKAKPKEEETKPNIKSPYYDNPERTAQIQRGNALNAASMIMSNPILELSDSKPETITKITLSVAEEFLRWLRSE